MIEWAKGCVPSIDNAISAAETLQKSFFGPKTEIERQKATRRTKAKQVGQGSLELFGAASWQRNFLFLLLLCLLL